MPAVPTTGSRGWCTAASSRPASRTARMRRRSPPPPAPCGGHPVRVRPALRTAWPAIGPAPRARGRRPANRRTAASTHVPVTASAAGRRHSPRPGGVRRRAPPVRRGGSHTGRWSGDAAAIGRARGRATVRDRREWAPEGCRGMCASCRSPSRSARSLAALRTASAGRKRIKGRLDAASAAPIYR